MDIGDDPTTIGFLKNKTLLTTLPVLGAAADDDDISSGDGDRRGVTFDGDGVNVELDVVRIYRRE